MSEYLHDSTVATQGPPIQAPEEANIPPNREALLPLGDSLRETYYLEFGALELPNTYRTVDYDDGADVVDDNPNPTIQEVSGLYVEQAAAKAYDDSWWVKLSRFLEKNGVDSETAQNLRVSAKRTFEMKVDGKSTGQNFEVFEIGESSVDQHTVEVVFDTLQLIDQLSGGFMSADPNRQPIILGTAQPKPNSENGATGMGVTNNKYLYLSLPGIKVNAEESGVSFHELLAAVIVHEKLGHSLEMSVEGNAGTYFPEHFRYSSHYVDGEHFKGIHESVTPKTDEGISGNSQPVREYGRVSAAEDFATSVDASVAAAMGWTQTTDKVPKMKSTIDSHRRDLVLGLMDAAAQMALKYDDTPGFVGNELRYTFDDAGSVTGIEPIRKMEIRTISGAEAVHEEIKKKLEKYRPGEEFTVSTSDFM